MKPEYSKTVNARIALQVIRHGVLLEQYKTAEVRKIVGFLNRFVEPDLVKKLQRYTGKELTQARIKELRLAVLGIMKDGYATMRGSFRDDLFAQGRVDAAAGAKIIRDAVPFQVSLVTPSVAAIRSMVNQTPIYGRFLPEWFQELSHTAALRVNQQVMIGAVEGEGIDQIVRRIVGTRANQYRDGILDRARSDVETVVRTAVGGVSNNAREETYRANTDIIKEEQSVTTLDSRTCEACMDLDGKVYAVGEGPHFPLHFSCRCTKTPILMSWKQLGINLKEAPEGTRASMDGQVPESLTYPEWLRRQSKDVQEEALGVRKAEMFRSGDLEIRQFVGDNNRILTLKELEAKL